MNGLFNPHSKELVPFQVGPLAEHLAGFAALLTRQHYCRRNGWQKIRLVSDLGQWLSARGRGLRDLNESLTEGFLTERRRSRPLFSGDAATLGALLRHLRAEGLIAEAQPVLPSSAGECLLADYERFLLQERALAPGTVALIRRLIERFLQHRFPKGGVRPSQLRPEDILSFISVESTRGARSHLQSTTSALRGFLEFLLQTGRLTTSLTGVVPTVAGWRLSELPRYLEAGQVERLLRSCDRRKNVGRRDFAILLLMARLGLRVGEVARLCLEDIDWRAGELVVRGKGARLDRLPLPEDVGQAIASYLKLRCAGGASRRVFLQSKAPYEGFLWVGAVSGLVSRALRRAGIDGRHRGGHVLRHSLATSMLKRGVSLPEISQVLRHQLTQTTEIYAKVDLPTLRELSQPWPGGAP